MRKTYLLSTVLVAMALGTNCHIAGTHPSISFEPEKRSLDGCKKIVFDAPSGNAVRGYWLVNTAHPEDDPRNWSLWGSDNEKNGSRSTNASTKPSGHATRKGNMQFSSPGNTVNTHSSSKPSRETHSPRGDHTDSGFRQQSPRRMGGFHIS